MCTFYMVSKLHKTTITTTYAQLSWKYNIYDWGKFYAISK